MNKAILMGRLTRDPEVRKASNDAAQSVAKYTLAVNRIRSNEGKEDVDFFNCVAFGARADFAEKYLRKGVKVLVTGRLQSGSYTNKDGQKVYVTEVIVEELEFTESRKSEEAQSGKTQGGTE